MAKLQDISARLRELVEQSFGDDKINTYKEDYIEDVNGDRNINYPLLLFKPPSGTVEKPGTSSHETHKIELIVMMLWDSNDRQTITKMERWDLVKQKGFSIINLLNDRNLYQLVSPVSTELFYLLQNDETMAVKFSFDLRVNVCYNNC